METDIIHSWHTEMQREKRLQKMRYVSGLLLIVGWVILGILGLLYKIHILRNPYIYTLPPILFLVSASIQIKMLFIEWNNRPNKT